MNYNSGVQLGVGCFGRVVQAEAVGVKDLEETVKTVAVKMVKSQINAAAMEALVSELKILIYLGSPVPAPISTSSTYWGHAPSTFTKVNI